MPLVATDLTEYLRIRRRMRLLPNLIDFGMAYSAFRPMLRIDAVLRSLARLKGAALTPGVTVMATSEPLLFLGAASFYLLYALLNALVAVALGSRLKSLVLSDSRLTVTLIGAFFLLIALVLVVSLMRPLGLAAALAFAGIPGIYVYAAFIYLRRLGSLAGHPVYRRLVGANRRSFAFATTRFAFFSAASLKVYGVLLLASWKAYLAYVGLGVLVLGLAIIFRSETVRALGAWFSGLPGPMQVLLGLGGFLLLSQVVAYARRFVANETTRFLRQLRVRLARSASALAQEDERPPILLLRSFQDDGIAVDNERYWGHRFLGMRDESIRLEEVIAETLYPHGPLIALSNPEDRLPPLGAAKENVAGPSWQGVVECYMEQAALIVVIVGVTPNLRWEVSRMLACGFGEKCLFVFPPTYRGGRESQRLLVNCLPELAQELGLRSEQEESEMLSGALVLRGVGLVVIKADVGDNAMAYAESLRLGALGT
jgi:hypothetical protein